MQHYPGRLHETEVAINGVSPCLLAYSRNDSISPDNHLRRNDQIRARTVLVIAPDGAQLGVMPTAEARIVAEELDLDVVEVAPNASPPVCRIMDWSKHVFDQQQKDRESRRSNSSTALKEMKYRPNIGQGDFDTKTRQVVKFLDAGHRVKLTVMFRGREVTHAGLGRDILDRVAERCAEKAIVESVSGVEGRNMTMLLVPLKAAK